MASNIDIPFFIHTEKQQLIKHKVERLKIWSTQWTRSSVRVHFIYMSRPQIPDPMNDVKLFTFL